MVPFTMAGKAQQQKAERLHLNHTPESERVSGKGDKAIHSQSPPQGHTSFCKAPPSCKFLNQSKQHHRLGTKCLHSEAHGGYISFETQQVQKESMLK